MPPHPSVSSSGCGENIMIRSPVTVQGGRAAWRIGGPQLLLQGSPQMRSILPSTARDFH